MEPRLQAFIKKHQADVTGILQGFDRAASARHAAQSLLHPASMEAYLQLAHVLWKDFKTFTTGITARIRAASEGIAGVVGRPFRDPPSVNLRKEDEAKKIALADGIHSELNRRFWMRGYLVELTLCWVIEILKCWSSNCSGASAFIFTRRLSSAFRLYAFAPQSWFPFLIHITLNGREWLARQMDAAGVRYERKQNCFTALEDVAKAQALFDRQLETDWPAIWISTGMGLSSCA